MGRRGPAPLANISTVWSANLAYAVGLLASDGCLMAKGHYVDLTSKDVEQLRNFSRCLKMSFRIGNKSSDLGKKYKRIQFKNVIFYDFLISIGLTPRKSKTLGALKIPSQYFFDFLRGSFDGDGCFYSYWDKRWRSSFMFYTTFLSASKTHIEWLRKTIHARTGVFGHVTFSSKRSVQQLKYAKADSLKILKRMYGHKETVYLSRKKLKIDRALAIVGQQL